jgi:acetyltransferase
MLPKDLTSFLFPKSVAVIGASRSPDKVGAIVLKNLMECKFPGKIYPVNPNSGLINDLICLPDIKSLPEVPDLAIVALPASLVIDTLNQLGEKGVKNTVVFSAGFKETGADGVKLEKDLADTAAKYNMNLLGPNCLGFVNNKAMLNATFGENVNIQGNLRFISQSGAIAAALFDWCQSVGLGFSQFITLGNKTVLNENDFLAYLLANPEKPEETSSGMSEVHPVGLYLESISNGNEFLKLTTQLSKTDPVFIIKPGKTQAAARAMQSHTGAIAGEDDIFEAALNQAGVVRCRTLEDFFDLSRAFAWENAPKGPSVAIISNAGGPAVISADAVVTGGLKLAEFDTDTKNKLLQALPRSASIINPVDVLGDALADRYAAAAEVILQTNQADALLVILTPQVMTQVGKTAELISGLKAKYNKPIFCSFIGGRLVYEGEQILNKNKIPSFRFPERAIEAIGAMWQWRQKQQQQTPAETTASSTVAVSDRMKEIVAVAIKNNQQALDSLDANEIMAGTGIPTPPTAVVSTMDEAREWAINNGWPVALKLSSPGLLHKAHLGGVVTDIWDEAQLEHAWDQLNHKIPGLPAEAQNKIRFQIQKDVPGGVEVIVGIKHDPTFGPVLLFGAGGQLAELVADRNLKILPVGTEQAKALVMQSKVYKLLQNNEGEPPYALDKLYDLIAKLTQLVPMVPEAADIEINPVIVTHNEVWAVDSKILLTGGTHTAAVGPKFHTATLVSNTILSAKFHYLELDTDDALVYQPGQYISIKVAPNRINSYSVAGNGGDHKIYLLIDTSPGGPGSKFFENVKAGDKIAYMGPFGTFTLRPADGAGRILFLGTGTGCSPLKSILEATLKNSEIKPQIDFYFGLRYSSDVFWQDYFQKLANDNPNFHFNLVLSKPDEGWHGQAGHITDMINQNIPDAANCSAYLCGNQKMIDEATSILTTHNCPKERIYTEKF